MPNSYQIFLKFSFSSFILIGSTLTYSIVAEPVTISSPMSYLVFGLIALLIITEIVFYLFSHEMKKPEYYLTRDKFEQSVLKSRQALQNIQTTIKPNAFVGNKQIDTLITQIVDKSKILVNDNDIDIKDKYIAQKSVSNYMPNIINTYNQISPSLRDEKGLNNKSAYDMTLEQLEIILNGLEEIELNLLAQKQNVLKTNGEILNIIFQNK